MNTARVIVEALLELGVDTFFLAPGSRSTPLALAIAHNPRAKNTVHFDERGVGFLALGYAKAANKPAVIVTTSGTAVGNLYPAVMEAHHAQVPLIILSADRPAELRDCGANQTCDQMKFFGDYVKWHVDLPCSDTALSQNFIHTTIAQAVYCAQRSPHGAIQINCMFREPFNLAAQPSGTRPSITHYEPSVSTLSPSCIQTWAKRLSSIEKGAIVVGSLSHDDDLKPICALAEKLQWPLITDITSNLRGNPQATPYADLILKTHPEFKPDAILHLGDRLVSKALIDWCSAELYCLVADHPLRHDPKHTVTHRLECSPSLFCKELMPHIDPRITWLSAWEHAFAEISSRLASIFSLQEGLTEPKTIYELSQSISPNLALFFANSMPIRDANTFFFPQKNIAPIFANRGLSGIDGNIATAVGIAQGCKKPTLAILGDLTSLHDLNSLALVKHSKIPVMLLIFNNHGGGIFSFLPIASKTSAFETHFAAAHTLDFSHAAALFDIPYFRPESNEDWQDICAQERSCIIEITTDRRENHLLHEAILCQLSTCFSSTAS